MPLSRSLYKLRAGIGFSHNFLSGVAMFTMLIDHMALTLIQNGKLYGYNEVLYTNAIAQPEARNWIILYNIMRMIGRISFPIFAFLIVEGFRKSSNLFKYILRLLLLAIISEIPYDLMVFNEILSIRCFEIQNVVFTYVIGLLMLVVIRYVNSFSTILSVFPALAAYGLTYVLKTDYALEGIILIYVFYMFRNDLNLMSIIVMIVTFIMSFEKYYGSAILSTIFIYLYDGTKGTLDFRPFRYAFYPLHMLILYGIVFFSNIYKG